MREGTSAGQRVRGTNVEDADAERIHQTHGYLTPDVMYESFSTREGDVWAESDRDYLELLQILS